MSNIDNTVFKKFTLVDVARLVELVCGYEKVEANDELKTRTQVATLKKDGSDVLMIGLGKGGDGIRYDLYVKVYANGLVKYVNWSECEFDIENPLEVYKLIIEKMG